MSSSRTALEYYQKIKKFLEKNNAWKKDFNTLETVAKQCTSIYQFVHLLQNAKIDSSGPHYDVTFAFYSLSLETSKKNHGPRQLQPKQVRKHSLFFEAMADRYNDGNNAISLQIYAILAEQASFSKYFHTSTIKYACMLIEGKDRKKNIAAIFEGVNQLCAAIHQPIDDTKSQKEIEADKKIKLTAIEKLAALTIDPAVKTLCKIKAAHALDIYYRNQKDQEQASRFYQRKLDILKRLSPENIYTWPQTADFFRDQQFTKDAIDILEKLSHYANAEAHFYKGLHSLKYALASAPGADKDAFTEDYLFHFTSAVTLDEKYLLTILEAMQSLATNNIAREDAISKFLLNNIHRSKGKITANEELTTEASKAQQNIHNTSLTLLENRVKKNMAALGKGQANLLDYQLSLSAYADCLRDGYYTPPKEQSRANEEAISIYRTLSTTDKCYKEKITTCREKITTLLSSMPPKARFEYLAIVYQRPAILNLNPEDYVFYKQELVNFKNTVNSQPTDFPTHFYYANICSVAYQLDEAIHYYQRAAELTENEDDRKKCIDEISNIYASYDKNIKNEQQKKASDNGKKQFAQWLLSVALKTHSPIVIEKLKNLHTLAKNQHHQDVILNAFSYAYAQYLQENAGTHQEAYQIYTSMPAKYPEPRAKAYIMDLQKYITIKKTRQENTSADTAKNVIPLLMNTIKNMPPSDDKLKIEALETIEKLSQFDDQEAIIAAKVLGEHFSSATAIEDKQKAITHYRRQITILFAILKKNNYKTEQLPEIMHVLRVAHLALLEQNNVLLQKSSSKTYLLNKLQINYNRLLTSKMFNTTKESPHRLELQALITELQVEKNNPLQKDNRALQELFDAAQDLQHYLELEDKHAEVKNKLDEIKHSLNNPPVLTNTVFGFKFYIDPAIETIIKEIDNIPQNNNVLSCYLNIRRHLVKTQKNQEKNPEANKVITAALNMLNNITFDTLGIDTTETLASSEPFVASTAYVPPAHFPLYQQLSEYYSIPGDSQFPMRFITPSAPPPLASSESQPTTLYPPVAGAAPLQPSTPSIVPVTPELFPNLYRMMYEQQPIIAPMPSAPPQQTLPPITPEAAIPLNEKGPNSRVVYPFTLTATMEQTNSRNKANGQQDEAEIDQSVFPKVPDEEPTLEDEQQDKKQSRLRERPQPAT